jgi:hypothetical protein
MRITSGGRLYPKYDLLFVNELGDGDHPLNEIGLADNNLMLIVHIKDKAVEAEQFFTKGNLK